MDFGRSFSEERTAPAIFCVFSFVKKVKRTRGTLVKNILIAPGSRRNSEKINKDKKAEKTLLNFAGLLGKIEEDWEYFQKVAPKTNQSKFNLRRK